MFNEILIILSAWKGMHHWLGPKVGKPCCHVCLMLALRDYRLPEHLKLPPRGANWHPQEETCVPRDAQRTPQRRIAPGKQETERVENVKNDLPLT